MATARRWRTVEVLAGVVLSLGALARASWAEDAPPSAVSEEDRKAALDRAVSLDAQVEESYRKREYSTALPLARESLLLREKFLGAEARETGASLLNLALLRKTMGAYAEAKPLYVRALAISEKTAGPEHPETGTRLDHLALLLKAMGDHVGARPLFERALAISEKANGPEHPETGASLNNLASLLEAMGDYAGAKPLFVRALAIAEKALGPEHRTTGTHVNNLAVLLKAMGDYAGAKPLLVRALAISEKELGPEHPFTGTSLGNLATLLQDMGDHAGAKPLFVRALAIAEKAHGPEHPSTATSLSNMASLLQVMGDYAGAKPLFVRALEISRKAFGPEHPATGAKLNNLALLLNDMGDYAGAKPLSVRALEISEKANGPEHPTTGTRLNNLASLLQDMGDYAGAKPLFVRALAISEKAFGPDHPTTGTRLKNEAELLQDLGDYAGAKPLFVRALAIAERAHGPEHPTTSARLNGLARLFQDMGDYAGAKPLFARALAISEKVLGSEHPTTGTLLNNLAQSLKSMGDYAGAKPLLVRALAISEKGVGPEHPTTGTRLNNVARVLQDMGDPAGAKPLFVRALAISEKAFGPEHPTTGTNLNNVAMVLKTMGDYAGAKSLFVRALAISEKAFGPEHPETGTGLESLGLLLQDMGDPAEAKPLFVRALAISEKAFGPEHPVTGRRLGGLASLLHDMGDDAGAKPLLERALAIAERGLRRLIGATQPSDRQALVRGQRVYLDAWVTFAPRVGLSGYDEVLRFRGLVVRAGRAERALLRRGGQEARERSAELEAAERLVSRLANGSPSTFDKEEHARWQERFAQAAARREAIATLLARDFATARTGLERIDLRLEDVQDSLATDEALVETLRTKEGYVAWIVRRQGPVARVELGANRRVEDACENFVRATAGDPEAPDEAAAAEAGRRLRDLVWTPIEKRLGRGVSSVVICPDAALAAVPFAALPGKGEGRFLLDEYRLRQVSMPQDLVPWKDALPLASGAVAIADVEYGEAKPSPAEATTPVLPDSRRAPRGPAFLPLHETRREAQTLTVRLAGAAMLLLGADATEARLRAAARGRRILHVATHGFVRDDLLAGLRRREDEAARWLGAAAESQLARGYDPLLLSGLALAGANPRAGGGDDDGILTAAEASYLDLDGCDLVVLSACDTALGKPESGEGVLGLVESFQAAGATHVVGSLWRVDDEATRLLMERFYEGYLRKESPLSPADALREAALWLRSQKSPSGRDFSAARHWAAFVAYGR